MTLHDYLFTLFLAMAPVSELRGAIPFGLAHDIPQALLYPSCILANLLPVPFVILFLRRILAWMQRKGGRLASAAGWLEKRGRAKSARIKRSELLGLYLFVAIPLPGTGAWTGALVAALLGKAAFPRHALDRGRRHDRLLHRRAFVQGHHPYCRFIDFYKSSVFPVGVDAHIDPLGSIEFAEDSRKIGSICRGDVGIAPYA
ncbi:MAG: small multi-drug export protein [Oscillospiraceae bacterium]